MGAVHSTSPFSIPPDALEAWRTRLAECDVAIEATMCWGRGNTSLYLRDPERQLIELATPGLWPTY